MNQDRRKQIDELVKRAEAIKNDIRSEEEEYKDAMPESLQDGEKGSKADEAISSMEDGLSSLEDAQSQIDDFTSSFETAKD